MTFQKAGGNRKRNLNEPLRVECGQQQMLQEASLRPPPRNNNSQLHPSLPSSLFFSRALTTIIHIYICLLLVLNISLLQAP